MERATVFFTDIRTTPKLNLFDKLNNLLNAVELSKMIKKRDLVAIKLHFGERGNLAYVRPNLLRKIVDYVRSIGACPFLTDTNTLYAGSRSDSISHIITAIENGFSFSVVGAPLIIADGLRGASYSVVEIGLENVKEAYIGKEIVESDFLLVVTHFKGHELSGFGGTLKNVGMGCAARRGKLYQHSDVHPIVKEKRCVGCGDCVSHCSQSAIRLRDKKAYIDPSLCIGCGECILICPNKAIDVKWSTDIVGFQKKMVEYAYAVLKNKRGRALFINFLTSISPACDCYPHSDIPIVYDIGIMASTDPVAIDKASVDMVNSREGNRASALKGGYGEGEDKFMSLYPKVNWMIQLQWAERIGLGTRSYKIVEI